MKKINILVPDLPESINHATIVKWYKKIGDIIDIDENIVDLETDKVMLEVSSPCNGILNSILEKKGKTVKSQQILGEIIPSEITKNDVSKNFFLKEKNNLIDEKKHLPFQEKQSIFIKNKNECFTPSIRRRMKIEKQVEFIAQNVNEENQFNKKEENKLENRVKMNKLRQKIAERLLYSKNNTAMLTTFNEVNMQSIILLRKKYGELFEKKHEVRIGFMSFFVKAVVQALKIFPEINASIDQTDIIYYKNFDISIAVSTPRGLITPVLRNADTMTMAEIEKKIKEFSIKGSENKINIKDLMGGNFTITNGGIFGSLMSTPIINPPQTAILGMHVIKDRPMVVDGKIKILPMMYLALSYDHRLIDGKESVSFLATIKNILEDFTRIIIDV